MQTVGGNADFQSKQVFSADCSDVWQRATQAQGAAAAVTVVLSTEDGNISLWHDFTAAAAEEDAITARVPGTIAALAAAPDPGGAIIAAAATCEHGVQLLRGVPEPGGGLTMAISALEGTATAASPTQARSNTATWSLQGSISQLTLYRY